MTSSANSPVPSNPLVVLGASIVLLSTVGGGILSGEPLAMLLASTVGTAVAIILTTVAVLSIAAGMAILRRTPRAALWAVLVGALNLINPPLGTLIGLYAFWIFFRPSSRTVLAQPN